jgi:hypothetical protein
MFSFISGNKRETKQNKMKNQGHKSERGITRERGKEK